MPTPSSPQYTLIENDHLGDWSRENGCFWRLTFRQPVRKLSLELNITIKPAAKAAKEEKRTLFQSVNRGK